MSAVSDELLNAAKSCGFDTATSIDVSTLTVRDDVRAMCEENKCGAYGTTWGCPPACGSLEACVERIEKYHNGILVQTIGNLEKTIDTKGYQALGERHQSNLITFADCVRPETSECLVLGSGPCLLCNQCAYPKPCRFPDRALSSMEAYGLFVTQVCRDAGVKYYYGPHTLAYTACVLFNE